MAGKLKALKRLVKNWLPPVVLELYRRLSMQRIRFAGHYSSWQAAAAESTGYDVDTILARVSDAAEKVKSGEALYERDSVLFDKVEHTFPLLALLMRTSLEKQGKLTVLDFGGSLGSSYFQCKNFLPDVLDLHWCVVEQEKFVARGLEKFESDELHFFFSIEECLAKYKPDVILFASVLQYLENADQIIDVALASDAEYIVIDRTPFIELEDDWICVQHVPASIYEASYPCAMLSGERLKRHFENQCDLLADFGALGGEGCIEHGFQKIPFEYKGMIWQKRHH
jgi:putative methyltransferase (TIGR04325 family)